jgi:RNA polymerase sigma factor (TIGR02999 family)
MPDGQFPDRGSLDYLFTVAYEELRRLAAAVKKGDAAVTLNPTALVNEAWVRLQSSKKLHFENLLHFKRIAARAMRQILIEAARRRLARKRGGENLAVMLPLEQVRSEAPQNTRFEDILSLEVALQELESLNERQATIVEARFFGGMEFGELMEAFGLSESTLMRDWRMARSWLAYRMRGAGELPRT